MEDKNNLKAVIAFVLAIIGLLIFLFYPDEKTVNIALIAMAVLGIAAAILGFMAKSELKKQPQKGKGLATASVVIGIIIAVLSIFGFLGLKMMNDPKIVNETLCPLSTDCVQKDENNYTCNYFGNVINCDKDHIPSNKTEE